MRVPFRRLLPVLLLCSPLAAQAQIQADGDYWIVHHQGKSPNKEMFVVDADPAHIVKNADGTLTLSVHQIYQSPQTPKLTVYQVGVDCAQSRVRIKRADEMRNNPSETTPLQVSSDWQASADQWLSNSRDFVCMPESRVRIGTVPIGKMQMPGMINAARVYFTVLHGEHPRGDILQQIDDALDRMPLK